MADAGSCPVDTKKKDQVSDTIHALHKIVQDFEKAANEDANRAPDASPWSLLHLSGMRRIYKAFHVVRELLVKEKTEQCLRVDMTIDEKHHVEGEVIKEVDKIINELL